MKRKMICFVIIGLFLLSGVTNLMVSSKSINKTVTLENDNTPLNLNLNSKFLDIQLKNQQVYSTGETSENIFNIEELQLLTIEQNNQENVIINSDSDAPVILYPSPPNGSVERTLSPYFWVQLTDPNGNLMTVTFRTNASGQWVDMITFTDVENGWQVYLPDEETMPEFNTTYYWSVHVTNGQYWTNETYHFTTHPEAPSEWNWKNAEYKGITGDWTTPARNQGGCGSCWAFGSYGAIESVISIREEDHTMDLDLSEQHILSCSAGSCDGWDVYEALQWTINNGVITEECFEYEADHRIPCSEKCNDWQEKNIPIKNAKSFSSPNRKDHTRYMIYSRGPVAATMYVLEGFKQYEGGVFIFNGQNPTLTSKHAVTIVGYKETPGNTDYDGYYIVKNSWGTSWGEDGFFKIAYYNDGKFRENYNVEYKIYSECFIDYQMYSVEYEAGSIPSFIVDGINDINYATEPDTYVSFHGVAAGGEKPYTWHWDFGNGYESDARDPTHKFEQVGYYNVTLTVEDNQGNIKSDTDEIIIDTRPTKPTIKGPKKGDPNKEYTYEISATDPDGDDLWYYVSWHDGNIEETEFFPSGQAIKFKHSWTNPGYYQIYVAAIDKYGLYDDNHLEVSLPRNRQLSSPLLIKLLQQFPVLRYLLKI